jgi:hypothetical protein
MLSTFGKLLQVHFGLEVCDVTMYKIFFRLYRETTFGYIISFQGTGETDLYTISGLDSSHQPLSIAWEVIGGDTVVDGITGLSSVKIGQNN